MSRLIDADKLIDKLKEYTRTNNCEFNGACRSIIEIVKQQPIAFDVDKVVSELAKLQEKANNFYYLDNDSMIKADTYKTAIEIVERGV